jgi:Spy/CpxP family protein refolding chaperone
MRCRSLVALASFAALVACQDGTLAPTENSLDLETPELVPDYAVSPAAVIDGAGIGASRLPEELKLTTEQKAQIAALHEQFMKDNAAAIAALRQLEEQLRAARRSGATRDQIRAILEKAHPILEQLAAAFKELQDAIWAVYTPAQKEWIESHKPRTCDRTAAKLSDAQIQQIRALQEAFQKAVADDIAFIRQVNQQARAAKEAGKSREEVAAILATALPAMERVRSAERKLHEDILAVLTPEQREAWWCFLRQADSPPPPRKP